MLKTTTSKALDLACKSIKGDCPRVIHDNEPWKEEGCNEVCKELSGVNEWKCWKQYFMNQARN